MRAFLASPKFLLGLIAFAGGLDWVLPDPPAVLPAPQEAVIGLVGYIIWFVVTMVVSYFATKMAMKDRQKQDPLSEGDVDIPQVNEGTPQAVLHGDCWTAGWTVLGWGHVTNRGIKSHGQVAWYVYSMSILMGLWRGPINGIRCIAANEYYLWQGAMTFSGVISINAPDAFGGEKKQGGVVGGLVIAMGQASQMPNAVAESHFGHALPAFRGRTTGFFTGEISANSLSPYPWVVRGWRTDEGWARGCWFPEMATIELSNPHDAYPRPAGVFSGAWSSAAETQMRRIFAKNPIHMAYEAYTDPLWGKGKDPSEMDDAGWRAAAQQCYNEGLGLCAQWQISDDVDSFLQSIADHIAAVMFTRGDQITVRLFRDDYEVDALQQFGPGTGLIDITEIGETTLNEAISEVIVTWKDPMTNQVRSTRQQNLGLLQAAPIKTQTNNYPYIPTVELANRVASRDLRAQGLGTRLYDLVLDRAGSSLEPGEVIVIASPAHGVIKDIVRVLEVDVGSSVDGHVYVKAAQDVFGLPSSTYAEPQGSAWVPPSNQPGIISDYIIYEQTYRDLVLLLGQPSADALPAGAGYISTMAVKPTEACTRYTVRSRRINESGFLLSRDEGPFVQRGILSTEVTTRKPCIITLGDIDLSGIALGSLALWEAEYVQITAINGQSVTLARGCLDTVPSPHPAGSFFWLYDGQTGDIDRSFISGETVTLQMIAFAGDTGIDPVLAGEHVFTMAGRTYLPYPPGDVRVDGVPFGEGLQLTSGRVLSWAPRNRLAQGGAIVPHDVGNTTAEPGASTHLRIRNATGTTLLDTTTTATQMAMPSVTGFDTWTIELWATRDGKDSLQRHSFTMDYSDNLRVTSDGSFRATTDGSFRQIQE
jgi:hypothetical protein